MNPDLALVGAAATHLSTRVANPFDSGGAFASQPVCSTASDEKFLLPMVHLEVKTAVNNCAGIETMLLDNGSRTWSF